jgi:hypothetical protein
MIRSPRTNPYIIRYGGSINHKKEKARNFNNGSTTTESFGERNSTFIFDGRGR